MEPATKPPRRKRSQRHISGEAAALAGVVASNGHANGAPKRLLFDIGQRRARRTVDVPIYDPADLSRMIDTGLRIQITSVFSPEAKEAAGRAAEGRDIRIEGGRVVASEDVLNENVFEQTIGATVGWFHVDLTKPKLADGTYPREEGFEDGILIDGVKVPCTADAVRQLYTDPETAWIQKQVEPWYLNIGNFFGGPKSESQSPPESASA